MEEAERCNQIAFISRGKILKIGKPNDLKAEISGQLLEVECQPLMKASSFFKALPGVVGVTAYGTTLHLNVSNITQVQNQLPKVAKNEGINITSIKPIAASLEDVFAAISEGDS